MRAERNVLYVIANSSSSGIDSGKPSSLSESIPCSLPESIPQVVAGTTVSHHVTNVALGPQPQAGRHTVYVRSGGLNWAIGTLEKGPS